MGSGIGFVGRGAIGNMSAIFGILRFDGSEVSARDLERMGNTLAHRGPDGRKFVIDGPVGFGHCLMRVNREDAFEAQPLTDREAELTLVADCRIDNREELAGIFGIGADALRDMPDSALVLRAYQKWGEDCAAHLLGDFAFAVWDGRARKLVLARDHMGQRCVHYHRGVNFLVFATDIKGLWACSDVPRKLAEAGIGRMLMRDFSARAGWTRFEGIEGLAGSENMTVGADGTISRRRYWEPRADPDHENRDEAYYVAAYRRVLAEAVACRVRRVLRPPGLVFSGGYDSAAIAGLAGPALAQSGHKLVAAASVMPADYHGQIRHARPWVEMCARDMPHLDVRYVTREGILSLPAIDQAYLDTGLIMGTPGLMIRKLLSVLAHSGAQLVMDGHGGDYTLNPRGQASLVRFLATLQFRRFWSELRGHLRLTGRSLWATLKGDILVYFFPAPALSLWHWIRRGDKPAWHDRPINRAFAERLIAEAAIDNLARYPRQRSTTRAQSIRILRLIWNASAARDSTLAATQGLELTRPFHDKRVVELSLALPEDLYVKQGRNRYLACTALKDVYPAEFQTRGRSNDGMIPDIDALATSVEAELLAEVDRLEEMESLRRYFDFGKIRKYLLAQPASRDRTDDDTNSRMRNRKRLAVNSLLAARYVAWFSRNNS